MNSFTVCAVAFVSAFAIMLLKNTKNEFVLPLRLFGSVLVLGAVVGMAIPIINFVNSLSLGFGGGEWTPLLLKGLCIAILCEVSSNICRESGEGALSSGIEAAGKVEILLLSLPLITKILDLSRELLTN